MKDKEFLLIEYTSDTGAAIRKSMNSPGQSRNTGKRPFRRQEILPSPRGDVASADIYDGPFALSYDTETQKIKIAAGYLSRNGEWVDVVAKELTPSTGIICVNSILGNGEWTAPDIKFTTPDRNNYPIGKCKLEGESVTLCSFRVPVAIILVSAECPLSAEADEEE